MKYFLLVLFISCRVFAVQNVPLKKGIKFIPKEDGLFIGKVEWLKFEKRIKEDRKNLLKIPLLQHKVKLLGMKINLLEQRLTVESSITKTYKDLYFEATDALFKERLSRNKWHNSKAFWFAVGFVLSSATYAVLKVSDK